MSSLLNADAPDRISSARRRSSFVARWLPIRSKNFSLSRRTPRTVEVIVSVRSDAVLVVV